MTSNGEKYISWMSVNNVFPIVVALITAALSFAALNTRISVLEYKMDTVITMQEKILAKYSDVERRYGELSWTVKELETLHVSQLRR